MRRWLKILRYILESENYPLMIRVLHSAWLVHGWLSEDPVSPGLKSAIAAAEKADMAPQPDWKISKCGKILEASGWIVRLPYRWGACVHQSLIAYRLLNGYGFHATINLGIPGNGQSDVGHAWVTVSGEKTGEQVDSQFLTVYQHSNLKVERG